MSHQKKTLFLLIVFCILLTSCHVNEPNNTPPNDQCIGSFADYAYDKESRSEIITRNKPTFVNPAWLFESNVFDGVRVGSGAYYISGERISENGMELWIRTSHPSYYDSEKLLLDNYILIYNIASKEWSRISAVVQGCDCIADVLFFDNTGNIWAKNAGNCVSDEIGDTSVLSKYNFALNVFEPVEITNNLFSGTLGEKHERIYYSEAFYDGEDSIWIFDYEGDTFIFDVKKDTITSVDFFKDMRIYSIAYDRQNTVFYLLHQKSTKKNLLRIPSDFEIIQFYPAKDRIERIEKHPYYWPNYSHLWIDQNGLLWFDTFGYLDSNEEWHLLMPNIGNYIYNTYFERDQSYDTQHIIAETSDGKLWFEGRVGIAWRSIDDLDGCWDSIYESDMYEDSNNRLWLINFVALYSREIE